MPVLARWWSRYWFAPATPVGLGIARIAVFTAVLVSYWKVVRPDYTAYLAGRSASGYEGAGVLRLFGDSPPSPALMEVIAVVGLIATIMAILGFGSRIAMPVSVISVLAVLSLNYGWSEYWSHGHNVQMLCGIALMFSRAGDALSVDAALRRRLGRSASPGPHGAYRWPVLLGQFLVAFMFANAASWKIRRGLEVGSPLAWALSDTLRNDLAISWYRFRGDPPLPVLWIMEREWAWKPLALGNLVGQLVPLGAVFATRRPRLRLIFAAFFLFEVLGLGFVVGLFHPEWALLAVFFVDWDWALKRAPVGVAQALEAARTNRPLGLKVAGALVIAPVIGYQVFLGATQADRQHRLYPFSSFPMYASIKDKPPLDEHSPYYYHDGHVTLQSPDPLPTGKTERVNAVAKREFRASTLKGICAALEDIQLQATTITGSEITQVRLNRRRWAVPAYPAAPRPVAVHEGALGELTPEGSCLALEHVDKRRIDGEGEEGGQFKVALEGFDDPEVSVSYRMEGEMTPRPIPSSFRDGWITVPRPVESGTAYFVFSVSEAAQPERSVDFIGPYMAFR